jgi:hypothetical protein
MSKLQMLVIRLKHKAYQLKFPLRTLWDTITFHELRLKLNMDKQIYIGSKRIQLYKTDSNSNLWLSADISRTKWLNVKFHCMKHCYNLIVWRTR